MLTMTECTRKVFCWDCDETKCIFHRQKWAVCPKYHCDNPNGLEDCDECEFMDEFIKEMREVYARPENAMEQ